MTKSLKFNSELLFNEDLSEFDLIRDEYEKIFVLQQEVLTMAASNRNIAEVISKVCLLAEGLVDNAMASVMLLDGSSVLNVLSSPSCPPEGIEALNGLIPGPESGSCGNVIFQQKEQFVTCIVDDTRWNKLRNVSEAFGLGACWSVPVKDEADKIIGTFALSSFEKRTPTPFHKSVLRVGASLVAVLLRRQKSDKELLKSNNQIELLSKAYDNAVEGVIITDENNKIVQANHAFENISGFKREDIIGEDPRVLASGEHDKTFYKRMWYKILNEGRWSGEVINRRKNGELYPQWTSISLIKESEDNPRSYLAIFSDLSELRTSQKKLTYLAYYDTLTGLANRTSLYEKLTSLINRSERSDYTSALLFLDLDRFKYVNDSFGHLVGDELLIQFATRLKKHLRNVDTIARLGGDEFVILLENVTVENALKVAQKVIDTLTEPFLLQNERFVVKGSIGVAMYPRDGSDAQTLLQHADSAMYKAKESPDKSICQYAPEMTRKAHQLLSIESGLTRALKQGEFELYFQPKIEAISKVLVGFEALIRWNHPTLGQVPPQEFIYMAEETGFITEIGLWVLEEACRVQKTLRLMGLDITISINLSAREINSVNTKRLIDHLEQCEIDYSKIEFELTETFLMSDVQKSLDVLNQFKRLGVKISIDDFGSGYSSLTYLKRFRVDVIKIDRFLLQDIVGNSEESSIVEAVITMGHALGTKVLAEGVETKEQVALLEAMGCDQFQGFYFDRPMSYDALVQKYVENDTPN